MTLDLPDFTKAMGGITKEGEPIEQFNSPPVWFHDGFDEGNFKWHGVSGIVVHDSATVSPAAALGPYTGVGCIKITSGAGATGSADRDITTPPYVNNLAFSVVFNLQILADFSSTAGDNFFKLTFYPDNANTITVAVAYVPSTGNWYVTPDAGAGWKLAGNLKLAQDSHHYLKLVFNITTLKYVTLYVDGTSFDVSAYGIDSTGAVTTAQLTILMQIKGDAGDTAVMYVDDVLLTYNEP